jgi:hypothetical protein
LHPSLEELSYSRDVVQGFLHVHKLIPELVDSRENTDGSVEKVPGMVDVAMFELSFDISEP